MPVMAIEARGAEGGVVLPSVWSVLRESAPRFGREGFVPAWTFYAVWRWQGFVAGIAAGTAVAAVLCLVALRSSRRGVLVWISLGAVLVQAVIGLATGSARLYLAQPAIVGLVMGGALLGSAALGRPLVALIASDLYPLPQPVRDGLTARRTFTVLTAVWASYLLARAVLRLAVLATGTIEAFLVISFVTGAPLTATLIVWSVAYTVRSVRAVAATLPTDPGR